MSKVDELRKRYDVAMHGMQAGVALDDGIGAPNLKPKHLRVGVNSALVDSGALAHALIKKGILTEEEYFESLVEVAELEHKKYEDEHSARLGTRIRLV